MLVPDNASTRQHIFTFVIEKAGTTIIEQVTGIDIDDAVARWYNQSSTSPGQPLEGEAATPIEGRPGVWCIGGHDPGGVFFLAHVVATAPDPSPR
jgi:hypothetical protein